MKHAIARTTVAPLPRLVPTFTAEDLRRYRVELGLRQYEFSVRINLSTVHLNRVENGGAPITDKLRRQILRCEYGDHWRRAHARAWDGALAVVRAMRGACDDAERVHVLDDCIARLELAKGIDVEEQQHEAKECFGEFVDA